MKKLAQGFLFILLVAAVLGGVLYLVGGRQYRFVSEIKIQAPASVVFAHLTETDKVTQWVDGLVEITPEDDQGHRVGSRATLTIQQSGNRFEMRDEVLESTPNQSLNVRTQSDMFDAVTAFRILPQEDGVLVKQLLLASHKGIFRISAPLVRAQIQRKIDNDLSSLKTVVERTELGGRKKSFEVNDRGNPKAKTSQPNKDIGDDKSDEEHESESSTKENSDSNKDGKQHESNIG